MGAPKLLGGVALIVSTVFYLLPLSMHLVSTSCVLCSGVCGGRD